VKKYSYDELKRMEYISVAGMDSISINDVTLFGIEQIHLHEYDHECIGGRILKYENGSENEIGNFTIIQNQGLSVDEKENIFVIETYF
jgi:hypothetical protein